MVITTSVETLDGHGYTVIQVAYWVELLNKGDSTRFL